MRPRNLYLRPVSYLYLTSVAQAHPDQLYGDGRTAEYPSTQGASATDLYDTGSGQGSRARRGR